MGAEVSFNSFRVALQVIDPRFVAPFLSGDEVLFLFWLLELAKISSILASRVSIGLSGWRWSHLQASSPLVAEGS